MLTMHPTVWVNAYATHCIEQNLTWVKKVCAKIEMAAGEEMGEVATSLGF